MSPRDDHAQSRTREGGWHAGPALLAAYAGGRAGPTDSWSVEMHLVSCAVCRAELALVLPARERADLSLVRGRVLAAPASSVTGAGLTVWVRARWLLRPAALVAALVAVLVGAGVDQLAGVGGSGDGPAGGVLLLLAPALPLAGVALCSVGAGDPWGEAVLATPSAGLRLTLWRTLAVLVLAVPAAAVAGLVLGGSGPVLWLLPCLALTALALAGGTVVALERAAAVLAGAWVVLVASPAVVGAGGEQVGALRALVASATQAQVFAPGAQLAWAVTVVVATGLLVHRRAGYEHLLVTRQGGGLV
ncbi:hypothetical protein [Pseudokineococcus sp. 1T1Z-3]|uniref:hypothetical protein n=1 Tax=Pseudokineococcus sp. 1T1Z-3 TaxID=3132745 RepID=UPI003094B6D4